jgi:hypothetical protein
MIHVPALLSWFGTKQSKRITIFLSCNGKTKTNIWLLEPVGDLARIKFQMQRGETKRQHGKEKEEECANNQQSAQDKGFCCHHHVRRLKAKDVNGRNCMKGAKVEGPDHCIHQDEDPWVFVQIESRLCKNNMIYYDRYDYKNAPIVYNSGRRKHAYHYAAFVLWEGINYHCILIFKLRSRTFFYRRSNFLVAFPQPSSKKLRSVV